jgi:hypothetical protein
MKQHLITAAFFMEGLYDIRIQPGNQPAYDNLLTMWDKGCIELVGALTAYVPFTLKLSEAGSRVCDGNHPGVFDYEVSSCFGKWYGEYILSHKGETPCQLEACAWLVKEVGDFFAQGLTAADAARVKIAINRASLQHYGAMHTGFSLDKEAA